VSKSFSIGKFTLKLIPSKEPPAIQSAEIRRAGVKPLQISSGLEGVRRIKILYFPFSHSAVDGLVVLSRRHSRRFLRSTEFSGVCLFAQKPSKAEDASRKSLAPRDDSICSWQQCGKLTREIDERTRRELAAILRNALLLPADATAHPVNFYETAS